MNFVNNILVNTYNISHLITEFTFEICQSARTVQQKTLEYLIPSINIYQSEDIGKSLPNWSNNSSLVINEMVLHNSIGSVYLVQ